MLLKTELYPYQRAAVDKLIGIRVGALYMEMGTGKTRTALEIISRRMEAGKLDKVLWLCPCSVKENLRQDIVKHADGGLAVIAIAGIESLSSSKRLTNLLMRYVSTGNVMLIVDESNLVKNHRAIRTQRIEQLANYCRYRMILNGTPISKNEADLYAQWRILDPRILGYQSFWSFAANHLEYDEKYHHKVRRVLNVDYLTDKISPYSYMVRKDEVLKLPDKARSESHFWLTKEQARHYELMMDAFLQTLIDEDDDTAIYRTFTALQEITSGRRIISEASERIQHESFFSDPRQNPRIQALLDEIEYFSDDKVIIWCKFQHEIDDIEAVLREVYGKDAVRVFCGRINQRRRGQAIEDFQGDSQFLVANKACAGYGLNLQFCHSVIYYNNDWDLATRAQSEDRVHRIGQLEDVRIVNLYAVNSIDRRVLDCLARKSNLADSFKVSIKCKNAREWLQGREQEGLDDKNRTDRRSKAS